MSNDKFDFFAFGDSLSDKKKKNKNVVKVSAAEDVNGNGIYTCAVCKSKINTLCCDKCGFDNSRNYEQYSTLQKIEPDTPAVSLFQALWNPPAAPSVEQTMALLRSQRWDDSVLTTVEQILNSAKSGVFDGQLYISDRKKVATATDKKADTLFSHKQIVSPPKTCPLCGKSNSFKSVYCFSCGAKLNTKKGLGANK